MSRNDENMSYSLILSQVIMNIIPAELQWSYVGGARGDGILITRQVVTSGFAMVKCRGSARAMQSPSPSIYPGGYICSGDVQGERDQVDTDGYIIVMCRGSVKVMPYPSHIIIPAELQWSYVGGAHRDGTPITRQVVTSGYVMVKCTGSAIRGTIHQPINMPPLDL